MNLNDIAWHDGVLQEISLLGSGQVKVVCDLYPDKSAAARRRVSFLCSGVKSTASLIDFTALLDNQLAGNISTGCIETHAGGTTTLKLFLSDGYVQIVASGLTLQAGPQSAP